MHVFANPVTFKGLYHSSRLSCFGLQVGVTLDDHLLTIAGCIYDCKFFIKNALLHKKAYAKVFSMLCKQCYVPKYRCHMGISYFLPKNITIELVAETEIGASLIIL